MIFNKAQKTFLKERGLWKKVKKYAKADKDYQQDPVKYGCISRAFHWDTTNEGHEFWSNIDDEFEEALKDIECT